MAWLDQNSFPLTYEERRVIDDARFSIVRPYLKEWNLLISEVRRSDSGSYRCTVNTNPVRSKITTLHVKGKTARLSAMCMLYAVVRKHKHYVILL